MTFTLEEGSELVKIGRNAMTIYLTEGREPDPPKNLSENLLGDDGISLTIEDYPSRDIRGYIGFPYPETPLAFMAMRAAIGTLIGDMRYADIKLEELDKIILRFTITSKPIKLEWKTPEDLLKQITIGKHGLIAHIGRHTGRLLPQVAVERGWSKEEFLSNLCIHAGLLADTWREEILHISTFTAQIFEEETPDGTVKEVILPIQ